MENVKFYKVSLGDQVCIASAKDAMDRAAEFVKANGGGVPKVEPCDEHGNLLKEKPETQNATTAIAIPVPAQPASLADQVRRDAVKNFSPDSKPIYSDWGNTVVDDAAKKRIEDQHAAIAAAGGPKIDTRQQFFATGTRMAKVGYDTQAARAREFQKKMPLSEAIEKLTMTVDKEMRIDAEFSAKEIANKLEYVGKALTFGGRTLTEQALRQMVLRLGSPAITYLLGVRDRVLTEQDENKVATDMERMTETLHYELMRNNEVVYKLRMRNNPRDVYAALSPGFGIADAPEVLEQLLDKMPADARGTWSYDQTTTSWELKANIWTPTPVSEQAVGEAFEGYISHSSRDNGTSSFNGGGGINILRCLNASTYSAGEAMRQIHRGKIMFNIKEMVAKSMKAIDALCVAWGRARKEEIEVPTGITVSQALGGYWRHLLNREKELVGVLPGRKENHVKELTRVYEEERRVPDRLVRSDFAQGWTRYIQDFDTEVRREAESAIGSWVVKPSVAMRYMAEKDKE